MTSQPQPALLAPHILIHSESSLIAATPPALGYVPWDSVVLWLAPRAPGPMPQVVVVPLSAFDGPGDPVGDLVDRAMTAGAYEALLVAWVDVPDSLGLAELPTCGVLGEVLWRAGEAGLLLDPVLTTNGRVWWSHVCRDREGLGHDCPEGATPLDEDEVTAVRAEFVGLGRLVGDPATRLPGRDPGLAGLVAAQLERHEPPEDLEAWRDGEIDHLTRVWRQSSKTVTTCPMTPEGLARVLTGLCDVRVRDTVMLRVGLWGPEPTSDTTVLAPMLVAVLRGAPDSHAAPPATLLAITAWLAGDQQLAEHAIALSRTCDPEYSLGRLADLMMRSALSPRAWRDGLTDLTEAECRTGRQDPSNVRRRARRVLPRRLAG